MSRKRTGQGVQEVQYSTATHVVKLAYPTQEVEAVRHCTVAVYAHVQCDALTVCIEQKYSIVVCHSIVCKRLTINKTAQLNALSTRGSL